MRFYHLWTTKLQKSWFCCLRTMKLCGGVWFCGLWGGEMNSEAVSMVTRPRLYVSPCGGG